MEKQIPKNIDEYITGFPVEVQEIMNRIRTTINEAAPDAIEAFAGELTGYKTSKGTIQFPYKNPIPLELITKIVNYKIIS
ncbi:hypothetical protein FACS189451_01430 [Bacteroidia bacterium]|nr:hypothetical protein FACS189451_01430 [Bacteroidia bacterium]